MNSGIYLLKFTSGEVYIGQAKDFDARWAKHDKDLLAGTHTKKVQAAYYNSNNTLPQRYKIVICHPDYLDLYEALLILQEAPPLNTQIPRPLSVQAKGALVTLLDTGNAERGILELLQERGELLESSSRLQQELEALKNSKLRNVPEYTSLVGKVSELETEVSGLEEIVLGHEISALRTADELVALREFRQRVRGAGWWERLWGFW